MASYLNLTLPLYDFMPVGNVWAWDVPFQSRPITTVERNGFELSMITMHSETGTRLMIPRMQDPNAPTVDQVDLEDLVMRDLHVADLYAPANWEQLSAADLDLSSTSPAVLADGTVVAAGKQGLAYLLTGTDLGGVGHQLAVATACDGAGAFGGMAVDGADVYVPCRNGLRQLTAGAGTLTAGWQLHTSGPGTPVVAGGALFDLARSGELQEIDPATGTVRAKLMLPATVTPFPALAAAGDELYAATGATVTAVRGA